MTQVCAIGTLASVMMLVRYIAVVVLVALSASDSYAGVIGTDDRIEILSDRVAPDGSSGLLKTDLEIVSNAGCTATLVDRDILLTAAHCIFDSQTDSLMDINKLVFYRGLNRTQYDKHQHLPSASPAFIVQNYSGEYFANVERVLEHGDFAGCFHEGQTRRCKNADWALLKLDVEYHVDWVVRVWPFSYSEHYRKVPKRRASNGRMYGAFYLAGYPASKEEEVQGSRFKYWVKPFMVDHQCQIRDVDGLSLIHDCDAERGVSGASFLFRYDDPQAGRVSGTFGIHSFSDTDPCPAYSKDRCSGGGLMSQAFIPAIKRHVRPEYTRHLR